MPAPVWELVKEALVGSESTHPELDAMLSLQLSHTVCICIPRDKERVHGAQRNTEEHTEHSRSKASTSSSP